MNRRNFLQNVMLAAGAALLPLSAVMPEDPYDKFLRTLRTRVIEVVRQDQAILQRIEIDPPTERRYRLVRIWTDRHPERQLSFYHSY